MPRVVGIDHLVLSVSDFARSKEFYGKLLRFLGFKRKYDYDDMTGWSNGKTCSGSRPPTRRAGSENIARAMSDSITMLSSFPAGKMSINSAHFWRKIK